MLSEFILSFVLRLDLYSRTSLKDLFFLGGVFF